MFLVILFASLAMGYVINWAIPKVLNHLAVMNEIRVNVFNKALTKPMVYLVTSVSVMTSYHACKSFIEFYGAIFLIAIGLLIAVVDFKSHLIPNQLSVITAIGGLLYVLCRVNVSDYTFAYPLISVIIGGGFIGLLALTSSMGGGDVKYMGAACLFLTPGATLLALFIAFASGGVFSVFLIMFSKAKKRSHIAFGPFLVIGVCSAFIWGDVFLQSYISWLSLY